MITPGVTEPVLHSDTDSRARRLTDEYVETARSKTHPSSRLNSLPRFSTLDSDRLIFDSAPVLNASLFP